MENVKNQKYCSNKKMVAYFIKHGVKPLDVTIGYNDTLLFLFNTEESQPLYEKWLMEKVDTI